jgi:hypothetical protein
MIVTLANAMFVSRFMEEVETRIDKILTIRKKYLASTTYSPVTPLQSLKKRKILS